MNKKEILKIILVNEISNEIENLYSNDEITKEVFRKVFAPQEDLMDTVPSVVGEDYFDKKVEELENSDFLFLSKEFLEAAENGEENYLVFDEKDVAYYLCDHENDIPEQFKTAKHINYTNEHLKWNASNDCVDRIKEKED